MRNKFLVIERYGDANGLSWRLLREGYDVKIFFNGDPYYSKYYRGMVPVVKDINDALDDDTIIIFSMSGMGKLARELKEAGYKVVGASSELTDRIEDDRVFAIEYMMKLGLNVPETHYFDKAKEAIPFVKSNPNRYVVKAVGESASDMTYVSKDAEDMINELAGWADDPKTKDVELILQVFVEGVETNPEIWLSGSRPIYPANLLFENKKHFPGNIGKGVGCAASTVMPYYGSKLTKATLDKIIPSLQDDDLYGPIDFACIIDKKGKAWYLESGYRHGYSAIYALCCLMNIPLGEFYSRLADGTLKEMPLKRGYGGALRMTLNPYPWENPDLKLMDKVYESIRGIHLPDFDDPEIFPLEVAYDDGFVTTGVMGIVAEIGGFGTTLKGLWDKIEKKAKNFDLPEVEYCNQNADHEKEKIDKFLALGFGARPEAIQ